MSETQYKNYLDRWKNQNWEVAGLRTAKTCIKSYEKWFNHKPETILDVGCMNGYVLKGFKKLGFQALGVEPNDFGNDIDVYNIPIHEFEPPIKFDFIICLEVMEHISEDLIIPSLEVIRMSLEGVVFFTISEDPSIDPTHVTIKPKSWWLDKFKEAGFTYHPDKVTMKGFNFYCLT